MIILKEDYQGFKSGQKVRCSPMVEQILVDQGKAERIQKEEKEEPKPKRKYKRKNIK